MLDLEGHGHSAKPHDPDRYSMDAWVDDVRCLVEHLDLERPSVVGYSLGAMIAGRLLRDPWVSSAALCGTGPYHVVGQDPDFDGPLAIIVECFLEGCWDSYPDYELYREFARLDRGADFVALAHAAVAMRPIPAEALKAVSIPVLVLNGGGDPGASDEFDLSPFIPRSRRVVGGDGDHGNAPSDPCFQTALTRFPSEGPT